MTLLLAGGATRAEADAALHTLLDLAGWGQCPRITVLVRIWLARSRSLDPAIRPPLSSLSSEDAAVARAAVSGPGTFKVNSSLADVAGDATGMALCSS